MGLGIQWRGCRIPMVNPFPWKRFWCRRENMFFLGDRGFLSDPEGQRGNILNPNLTTFDELQSVACLALLGEPGVGKSWSLSADVDAYLQQSPGMPTIRLDLRSFRSEDRLYRTLFEDETFLQWAKGDYDLHLYIDSLDECLLRIDSVAALLADEIPKYPLDRLKLRIACRTASWPPLLEKALKSGYGENSFAATELVPLRRVDVLQAATLSGITDTDSFLGRVDELHITSLAIKPVTLKMLLDTFQREGDLPGNVVDLYEKGCSILCEEQNESRRASRRTGDLSPRDRIAVASRVAAATQFGNRFAVWTGTEAEGVPEEDVAVGDLVGEIEPSDSSVNVTHNAVLETLGTGLFSSRGQERLGWSHQMFAEFLAARYCFVHELPIEQLRSLVFHPRRRRVIPQVREVASWIALRNDALFAEIAEFDPEVLLGSAAPSLSNEQRRVLADALLRSCDQSEVLHIRHHLELRHLAHPLLAEQLEPVLVDRERSVATRYFAARIARDCAVTCLGGALLGIALSDAETHDLRTIAAYAIADVGSEEERNLLHPLLQSSREIDPNDQLRGAALNAIYPGDKYDDAMWDYLESPRQALFGGSYSSFLYYSVVPKLNAENLPAALRWCAAQPPEDIGPIPDLEADIVSLALVHIEKDGIADLLANTVFQRSRSFRPLPSRRGSSSFSETLASDTARRRRFLEAFLPLLNRDNAHFVMHPMSLLVLDDLQWYIDRILSAQPSSSAIVEALLVCRLACSWEPEAVNTVWHACQRSPILSQECNPIFEPVSLDSEMVQWQRKSKADLLKERNIEVAPALEPRCEAALQLIEGGEVDAWLKLLGEMSLDEGGTHYLNLRQMEVEKLPGWLGASEGMRGRIVAAAKIFLMETPFRTLAWYPSTQVPYLASAGVNALAFLYGVDLAYLQGQSVEFWAAWIPSMIGDSRVTQSRSDAIDAVNAVFVMAASAAPATMNEKLLEQIQMESDNRQFFFAGTLVDLAWSDSLGEALLAKLQMNDLALGVQAEILFRLVQRKVAGAKEWAEEAVRSEYNTERGIDFSKALLKASDDAAWKTLWPFIQTDTNYGRRLLEGVSYGFDDKASFTNYLNDLELGELYLWLLEQYPPDGRMVSGAVGPVDMVRMLRDGSLEKLKRRATFEACDALARAELRLPQYRWLRFHFDEAEVLACASTWEAQSPHDIIAMASDSKKRFVESSQQLLDVILESLSHLQAELHGELASVGDLWNCKDADWWPKQEEDVSDYVARHLKKDLADRGIVINREVQIRRGRRGEMPGQSTDIHVDAVREQDSPRQLYGPIGVVIEVKGSWNDGLLNDMEGQLRDRYLKNSEYRAGLYVVAHFKAARWIANDRRRAKSEAIDISDLRQQLANQADGLSGSVLIQSLVLDASLDSTTAT
jgi:hypothetical protein